MDPMDPIGTTFYPLEAKPTWVKFFQVFHIDFSIGIGSCQMDPMDTIGETFYPLIQRTLTFSKSPTNRS